MSMRVGAAQQADARNSQISYLNSALVGGLLGHTLKYALPLNEKEQGTYNDILQSRKLENQRSIRREFLEAVKEAQNGRVENKGVDLFIKVLDGKNTNPPKKVLLAGEYNALNKSAKDTFKDLVKSMFESQKTAKRAYEFAARQATKTLQRPTAGFIGLGVAVGVFVAFWYNVFQKIINE